VRPASRSALLEALLTLVGVWTLLLGAACSAERVGDGSTLLGVGCATALVLATRSRGSPRSRPTALLLSGIAGAASLPLWLSLASVLGAALGIEPPAHGARRPGAVRAACDLALGPVLEEALYRERLLPALRAAGGAPLALALSSALFALSHGDAWLALAALGAGLALGALYLATRSLGLCIAAHAGLNLAAFALAWGVAQASP
jgi:membrane protease YdiL (CAAX protease family)